MKKQVIVAWILLLTVIPLLAGCAGGAPATTTSTPTPTLTTTSTPTPTATPKPTTTVTPTPTTTTTPPPTTTTPRPLGWVTAQMTNYPPPRFGHAMTTLPDGRILMFGGIGKDGVALKDTWIFSDKVIARTPSSKGMFNLLSQSLISPLLEVHKQPPFADWSPITPPDSPSARQGHSLVVLPDGRVMLFGGIDAQDKLFNDLHTFDSNKWSPVNTSGTTPPARCNHDAWLSNNKMYVQGGIKDVKGGTATLLIELWVLDLKSLAWAQLPKPPDYISPYGSPFIIGNKVYLLDPHRFDATGGTVQVYDMDKNLWEQKKLSGDYPHGERAYYSMTQVGSNAYTIGGQIWDPATKSFKDSTEVFVTDLTTFITKKLPDIPHNFNGGAVVYDSQQNRLVAWGGKNNKTDLIPGNEMLFYNLPN